MLSEKEKPGLWGEIYAARFMRENGYEIITANYRCRLGEIDIIAKKDGFLVFTEVKTRSPGAIAPGHQPRGDVLLRQRKAGADNRNRFAFHAKK